MYTYVMSFVSYSKSNRARSTLLSVLVLRVCRHSLTLLLLLVMRLMLLLRGSRSVARLLCRLEFLSVLSDLMLLSVLALFHLPVILSQKVESRIWLFGTILKKLLMLLVVGLFTALRDSLRGTFDTDSLLATSACRRWCRWEWLLLTTRVKQHWRVVWIWWLLLLLLLSQLLSSRCLLDNLLLVLLLKKGLLLAYVLIELHGLFE